MGRLRTGGAGIVGARHGLAGTSRRRMSRTLGFRVWGDKDLGVQGMGWLGQGGRDQGGHDFGVQVIGLLGPWGTEYG